MADTPSNNKVLTPDLIARESSLILHNILGFGAAVDRRYDDRFANSGGVGKAGESFDIRIPPRYMVTRGTAMPANIQASEETKRTITVGYSHVPLIFTDKELLLDINDFSNQFLRSAVASLANFIDLDGTKLYEDIHNISGTIGGGAPNALATYLEANAKMTEEGTPEDIRQVCINANQNEKIIDALKGLYHDPDQISMQYRSAKMRTAAGFNWLSDQNMYLHTCGSRTNGATVGAPGASVIENGTQLKVDGLGNATTYKKGDCFSLADIHSVNPQSRQSTMRPRSFVVTEDGVSSGGGAATLNIYPALIAAGKDQTVDALPGDNTVLTWNGTAGKRGHQGLSFHPEAFALAMVDDMLPDGVDFKARTSPIDGQKWRVSLSIIRDYDIKEHAYRCRVGAWYGWLTGRPEMACRVSS